MDNSFGIIKSVMQTMFPSQRTRRFLHGFLGVLALTIGICGAHADPPVVAVIGTTNKTTRGGIDYIPGLPVKASLTPKFDEKNPPPQSLTYGVQFDGGNGAPVSANLYIPTSVKNAATKAPAVLVLHGLGGKKEDVAILGMALANKGYVALAIDIAGHGARPRFHDKAVADLDVNETRTVIGQTVADLRRAVDFLATRPEVDMSRVGFAGASIGGIIGGVFIGDEPRIQSASLWSAGGDWGKLMMTSAHPFAQKYHKPGAEPEEVIAKTLSDVDPLNTIGKFTHPVLFLYGDKDTWVPTPCIEELFNAAHEPKKKIVYPGGHIPDPFSMLSETVKWFDASLKTAK